jgi:predicted permease
MSALLAEVRSAARSLARVPTVTVSAICCLGLGIGAATAISSAINRALLQPAPFRDPAGLVAVHRITPQSGPQGAWPQSAPNYVDLARDAQRIQGLAAMSGGTALIQMPDDAFRASQQYVTGNLFATLGVNAQVGRLITVDDDRLDQPLVAAVSDEFWRTSLGADPSIVGSTMSIDGEPTTIIGILPRDFRIPHAGSVIRSDIWMPIRFTPQRLAARRSNYLRMLGRLAPDANVATAESEMRTLFAGLMESFPQLNGENLRVAPLQAESVASIRTPLLLLFAAVGMVLLIASTNVAALLLARGVQRRREVAVRAALGASRWDTMRPALMESFLIATAGSLLGLGLAWAGVRTIGALAAERMPQLDGLGMDPRVIGFGLGLALVVAVLCGAAPAWRGSRTNPQDALREGRGSGGREQHAALRSLVVLEIALSLVLLIGAGLVLKGFAGLLRKEAGFETAGLLTMQVTTSATRYSSGSALNGFLEPALDAIRAVPGVEAAGGITLIPYDNWGSNSNIRYEGVSGEDPTRLPIAEQRSVSSGFFDVTGQRLVAGRLLRASDDGSAGSPAVVVVNEALVARDFPGRDPIGQRFHTSDTTFATIVGVVSDVRNRGPVAEPGPEMYWSYRQNGSGSTNFPLMVRVAAGDPVAALPAVREALRNVDPTAAIGNVRTMEDVIARSLGRPRFYFSLLGTFAGVALVLSLAGLYGVLSYAVAQRTREIGIRTALGSSRSAIMRLVVREGMLLVTGGVVLGLVVGLAVTRLLAFMLYGVSPLDAGTWLLAALLMVVAALAAAVMPARRAARVDPLIAMRAEA